LYFKSCSKRLKQQESEQTVHVWFALVFFVFFFSSFLQAQDTVNQFKRPKIGLVLSGGGAKGLAHIGVLKVIDEAGIKIDYIGGTSMGAIVGGLYAAGYTGKQLDSIFKAADYNAIIQDYTPRNSKNYYEREYNDRYAVSLPFHKFKVSIPLSLSKGLYNYNSITRLTHEFRHERDFKKLPIPFICIATDIETGQEVILDHGFLAQAIIASGALPTLYSPVIIEGKYLIDGGVLNNFPVDEVIRMGADIIIGVDVQDELKDRDQLTEATKLLVQISNLQMIKKMEDKRILTDIYIKPEIGSFSVVSFDKTPEIIKIGEEAAFSVFEKLKNLSSDYKKQVTVLPKFEKDSLYIRSIRVDGLENYTKSYVISKLRFKPGSKITYADLVRGIDYLNTTQNFSSLSYTLDKEEEGDRLNIFLTENPTKTYLKFGLHYDGLFKSAALVNLTQKKLLFKNDVFSGDLALGDHFRYFFDYNVNIGYNLSFGVNAKLYQFNRNVSTNFNEWDVLRDAGTNSINVDYSNIVNQVYFQTLFMQKFSAGFGLELMHLKIESETLQNSTDIFDNGDFMSLFGYLKFDSFDNKFFPRKGWSFNGDAQSFLYASSVDDIFFKHNIFKAEGSYVHSFFPKTAFTVKTEGGFTIGEQNIPILNFLLGGYGYKPFNYFRHFYGYDFVSLAGDSYVMAAVNFDVEFFKKNHLNFTANFANIGNNIFVNDGWFQKPAFSGYAIGYGIESILGPIEVKQSWSPEAKESFTWISVGFWF
jgi:NTE family protein